MDFLRRLLGRGTRQPVDNAMHLYVCCSHCGAPVHVRVNPANDVSVDYGDTAIEGYFLRKEIMDSRCFRLMHAEVRFDHQRRELSRSIEGGEFITRERYEELLAGRPEKA